MLPITTSPVHMPVRAKISVLHPVYSYPTDNDRIRILLKLIEDGFINNILIGNDVCMKYHLHKYGGFGYDYFLNNVLPILKDRGLNEKQVNNVFQKFNELR